MSPSSFIGRIGGLAAALGIGAAVFSVPGVAWAEPNSAGASDTSGSAGTSNASGPASRAASVSTGTASSGPAAGASRTHPRGTASQGTQQAASTPPALASLAVADSVPPLAKSRSSSKATGVVPRVSLPVSASAAVPSAASSLPAVPTVSVVAPATASTVSPAQALAAPAAATTAAVTSNPLAPPHGLANVIATVASHVSTVVSNVVNRIAQLFSGSAPLAPPDTPALWALLAAVRKQLLPGAAASASQTAASASQTAAATVSPTLVLNGYNVVAASPVNVVSLYGQDTHWPSFPATVQGQQQFNLVDPTTNQTVGSFNALVSFENSNSLGPTNFTELVVTKVLSGTPGATAGMTPPVGSVISVVGAPPLSIVYSAMPTPSGDVVAFKLLTPFGNIPLPTAYDAAKNNTDNALTYKPLAVGKGFYIGPTADATETQISVTGYPPLFTAVQGAQNFSVYDSANKAVGSFQGLVTSTSDVAGIYTKAILVTANDGGADVGTGVGQVPPVGSVYNVIYFWSDKTYVLYSSKPSTPKNVLSAQFVSSLGTSPLVNTLDASKPPAVTYQVPGGYKFVPVSNLQPVGVNGLPPREVIVQGYQQFDVYDSSGKKIGSFDADVCRQWDDFNGHTEALLVTNVTGGDPGVTAGAIPPVGSVFNFNSYGLPGFSDFYSSMPGPSGDLIASVTVTPFGNIPAWTPYDASLGLQGSTYVDPFTLNPLASQATTSV